MQSFLHHRLRMSTAIPYWFIKIINILQSASPSNTVRFSPFTPVHSKSEKTIHLHPTKEITLWIKTISEKSQPLINLLKAKAGYTIGSEQRVWWCRLASLYRNLSDLLHTILVVHLPSSKSPRTPVCIDVIGCSCTSQHRDKNRLKAKLRMHITYAKTRSTKTLSVNSLKMHLSQGPKIDQPLFLITLAISFPAHWKINFPMPLSLSF